MIKYIEQFAENIVDWLDNQRQSKKHHDADKKNSTMIEAVDYSSYEIIPYHLNTFDEKTFQKLLNSFSYYSDRINFFVYWNNSNVKLLVNVPTVLEDKFVTNFYNFFPSSKLEKVSDTNFNPEEYLFTIDEPLKIKNPTFFKELFFVFKDVPSDNTAFIRYSLVLNSTWEVEYEGLLELIRNGIKLFFRGIYYFFHQVFLWQPPKKRKPSKKQQLQTGIKWTAISVWIGGNPAFNQLVFKYFSDNAEFPIHKQSWEIFSPTKVEYFSKIFHIPTKSEKIPFISYINYKRLPPPANLPKIDENTTILWNADWADEKIKVGLKQEDKARHVYIVGKTGVWKSTLLSNMVYSDLQHGKGLALIDPHGDLVETILSIIPENRVEDVVLFDVSDTEHPVWFNPFSQLSNNSTNQEKNKDLLVSTILSVFKKLYGYSWGPRLEYILRNVLISLSDYPNANFLDIIKILTDKSFRQQVIKTISDPVMKNFWEKEFAKRSDRFASEAISPILNKIGQFVSSNIVRNIFGQTQSTINIQEIMNSNKILLVNLSKWLIWEDNSALLGSFIVSQIQVETMKRAMIPMKDRKHFSLYIDEFQNFATDSFAVILSEARKYNLSLIVANQYISQIEETVQNAIFGNVGNLIAFNSWNQDAEILAKQFKNKVTAEDIVSIPRFKAYAKIMIDGTSTDVFGLATYPISEEIQQSAEFVARLKALSNKKYTQPRQKVEEQISKTLSTTKLENLKSSEENKVVNPVVEEQKLPEEQKDKKQIKQEKQPEKDSTSSEDLNDVFEWVVKLKFNYGLFVVTPKYEWLLHKKIFIYQNELTGKITTKFEIK